MKQMKVSTFIYLLFESVAEMQSQFSTRPWPPQGKAWNHFGAIFESSLRYFVLGPISKENVERKIAPNLGGICPKSSEKSHLVEFSSENLPHEIGP